MYSEKGNGKKQVKVQNPSQKLACIQWRCCCVFGGIARELFTSYYSNAAKQSQRTSTVSNSLDSTRQFQKNVRLWPIEKASSSITTMLGHTSPNRRCENWRSWNGKFSSTHRLLQTFLLQIFICSGLCRIVWMARILIPWKLSKTTSRTFSRKTKLFLQKWNRQACRMLGNNFREGWWLYNWLIKLFSSKFNLLNFIFKSGMNLCNHPILYLHAAQTCTSHVHSITCVHIWNVTLCIV